MVRNVLFAIYDWLFDHGWCFCGISQRVWHDNYRGPLARACLAISYWIAAR